MIISCPRCGADAKRAGFPLWTIIVSIVFFPIGLVSLLVGRKVTKCETCEYKFRA